MTLIDGKAISEQVKQEIAAEVAEIVAHGGKRPHLAAILVGHDGGSETYVAAKVKACEVCGFKSSLIRYESDVTEDELLAPDQCRTHVYRTALLCIGHSEWNPRTAETLPDRDIREKVRRIGTQQYCWQTDGCTDDAEGLSGRRYGDRMSQPLKRSGERVPGSRYHYRCIGTT